MHLFKVVTGQSFVAYLNRFRIARAQNLLTSTNKAIVEISLETGFCNQSYFGVIFRRIAGISPLEYRFNQNKAHLPANHSDSLRTAVGLPPLPPHVRNSSS
jgi:transcriptional regulator GlxA family with amidase domain